MSEAGSPASVSPPGPHTCAEGPSCPTWSSRRAADAGGSASACRITAEGLGGCRTKLSPFLRGQGSHSQRLAVEAHLRRF
eukprot:15447621-Alexandrium_andersonii.AAC.1